MEGRVQKQKHKPGFTGRYWTPCSLTWMSVVCSPHDTIVLEKKQEHKNE